MSSRLLLVATFVAATRLAAFAQQSDPRLEILPQNEPSQQFTLVQVLSTTQLDRIWFTDGFLAANPLETVQARMNELHQVLGSFVSVRPVSTYYQIQFSKGRAKAKIGMIGPQISSFDIYDEVSRVTDDGSFRLAQIFQASPLPPVLFSPGFLREYPLNSLAALVASLKHQYGAYESVSITGEESYIVQFARGATGAKLHLDENEKVDGLSFVPLANVAPPASHN